MSNIAGGNQLLNPLTILRDHLKIAMDARVADLGCGSMGFFSLQAAALAGDKGQVYAVDILKEVLSSVEGRARQAGLYNIKTVWSNLEVVGRLLVVDWLPAGGAIGPATEMRIDPEEIKQLAAAAGYTLQSEFAAGASHYGLIFKK
ncbi:MAG: Methyltransferase type 11 [Parcubacteria group bacterium GW2011_GWA2_43_17]|nr:MAG: Methyltransferase type 11 [Parcubacteria group bacterium GW2011_GWA2_43_17]